jgi:hypothetical protein
MATFQVVRRTMTTKVLPPRNTPSLPKKPWALIAYIAGDNDLSDDGLEDVEEMSQEGTDKTAYAGVEIDTIGEHDGSIRYEICEPDATGEPHRMVIERLKERNTGDPRTLVAFLEWGLGRFTATNRVVVVWGHGTGFRTPRRDVAGDDSAGGGPKASLSIPDLERALGNAGIGADRQFGKMRVLGFDACLMAMLEIAHHLRDQVEFLVGSQELEPGQGWPYDRVLAHLKGKPTPRALAEAIVLEYVKSYRRSGETGITQSAIDTAKTPAVVRALHDLGAVLTKSMAQHPQPIIHARVKTLSFAHGNYVDLIDMADNLTKFVKDPKVKTCAARLKGAADAAIVLSKVGGKDMAKAHGMSVWYPSAYADFTENRAKYLALHINDERREWVDFLDARFDRLA